MERTLAYIEDIIDEERIKQGFRVNAQRIINPASVFCIDRNLYYKSLSLADTGRTDRLSDQVFLSSHILIPAINFSLKNGFLSPLDSKMLKVAVERKAVQAVHFKVLFRDKLPQEVSRQIKRLRDAHLLVPETDGGRQYVINIRCDLLRLGILNALDHERFLPDLLPEKG